MDNFKRRYHLCLGGHSPEGQKGKGIPGREESKTEVEGEVISMGKISLQ